MKPYTAKDVALILGVSDRRVRALAVSRQVGFQLNGMWLFHKSDVKKMLVRKPGRPNAL